MRLFDAHCHLCDMPNFTLPESMLCVTSGYSHESNLKNAQLVKADKTGRIFCIMGIAPQTAQRIGNIEAELGKSISFIRDCNSRKDETRLVAIGEIGLDNHWGKTGEDRRRQKFCFEKMLELAGELHLPIVIQSRDAETEVLDALADSGWCSPFLMHCFAGKLEEAERALNMGSLISIPPIKSKERKKIMRDAPLSSLLAETDAPYIGKTLNDINLSLQMIAEAKGTGLGEAAEATYENARKFFAIGKV
jgi:TatD family hydrolase